MHISKISDMISISLRLIHVAFIYQICIYIFFQITTTTSNHLIFEPPSYIFIYELRNIHISRQILLMCVFNDDIKIIKIIIIFYIKWARTYSVENKLRWRGKHSVVITYIHMYTVDTSFIEVHDIWSKWDMKHCVIGKHARRQNIFKNYSYRYCGDKEEDCLYWSPDTS